MPNGVGLGQLTDLLKEIKARLTEGGTPEELEAWFDFYNAYLDALEYQRSIQPEEISEWELEKLALDYAKLEWSKTQDEWGRNLAKERLGWEREEAWLPYRGMTAWQQQQAGLRGRELGLQEMQYAAQLAARGKEAWIERWYAEEARRARFEAKPPSPWYMKGRGLAGVAGWEGMRPEERGEWLRRKEKSLWAGIHPEVQEMVMAGYGFPKVREGEQFGIGETWGGFAEAPQPEWEQARGTTSQFLPSKTIDIKPSGEIKIREEGGMPERGRAGMEARPSRDYRDVYLGRPAPTAPVGEAPPRKKGRARARPRPTAPLMPAELAPFLPQAVVGEPIEKGWQIPPPSAQLWGRTPPSTRAMLRGYTQWGGEQPYEDILWGQQQRQMPTRAGRWKPARQWV